MFSDVEFVEQTLVNNLFYLRNMNRYAKNLELSFLPKDPDLINLAADFALRCVQFGNELVAIADQKLSRRILNSGILFTEYTIALEKRTVELFATLVDIEISEKEINLKPGKDLNPSPELIARLKEINYEVLKFAKEFLNFVEDIYEKERRGELFTYSDPFLVDYMANETESHINVLTRLIANQDLDPSFVSDFEYKNNEAMRDIAILIRSYIGSSREDLFIKAQSFVREYDALLARYRQSALSPDTQEKLTKQSEELLNRFGAFMEKVIQDLLNSKAYFIIEPIFLDSLLTHINYFKYFLKKAEEED